VADAVHVEGLKELNKLLKAAGEGAEKDLRRELKTAGVLVQREAQALARANGLVRTGALVRGIKVGYSRTSVIVYETASRRSTVGHRTYTRASKKQRVASSIQRRGGGIVDFPYPIVYEFGGRQSGNRFNQGGAIRNRSAIGARLAAMSTGAHGQAHLGPRAFMYPALANKADQVVETVGHVVDKFTKGEFA